MAEEKGPEHSLPFDKDKRRKDSSKGFMVFLVEGMYFGWAKRKLKVRPKPSDIQRRRVSGNHAGLVLKRDADCQ
jgi:hypothetical protein